MCRLLLLPEMAEDNCVAVIKRFVVLLFAQMSTIVEVNQARKIYSYRRLGALKTYHLQPTQAAMEQHTMSAVFQEAYIWGQVRLKQPVIPPPSAWGFEKVDNSSSGKGHLLWVNSL